MADEKKSKGGKTTAKAASKTAKAAPKAGGKGAKKAPEAGTASPRGAVTEARPTGPGEKPRMAKHYEGNVVAELMKKFSYKNVMQAPKFLKIVVNMGVGDALVDAKLLDAAMNELGLIAGQRPSVRRAKKSISNFKLRAGSPVGCTVTLRGARMFEFYDRKSITTRSRS
jgi:hypothetical protein